MGPILAPSPGVAARSPGSRPPGGANHGSSVRPFRRARRASPPSSRRTHRRQAWTTGATGARTVRHGRYVTFQMAEVAVSERMFEQILARIARLRAPPVPTQGHAGTDGHMGNPGSIVSMK